MVICLTGGLELAQETLADITRLKRIIYRRSGDILHIAEFLRCDSGGVWAEQPVPGRAQRLVSLDAIDLEYVLRAAFLRAKRPDV